MKNIIGIIILLLFFLSGCTRQDSENLRKEEIALGKPSVRISYTETRGDTLQVIVIVDGSKGGFEVYGLKFKSSDLKLRDRIKSSLENNLIDIQKLPNEKVMK